MLGWSRQQEVEREETSLGSGKKEMKLMQGDGIRVAAEDLISKGESQCNFMAYSTAQ